MDRYKGYYEVILNEDEQAEIYSNEAIRADIIGAHCSLVENCYYLVMDDKGELVDTFCYQKSTMRAVRFLTLGGNYTGIIKPRNPHQLLAFDMLKDTTSQIKLITGKFGTGKTLALVNGALEMLERGKIDKIYWVRNNVQVKDTDPLGALPGDAHDKMLPYLGPFFDHAGGVEGVRRLIEDDKLEVIPLGFLRGRSLRKSIVISSEAENLTKEQIQLLIGRIDEGSQLWIDGDLKQRDRTIFEKSAGLETLIERLKNEELFAYVHLEKTERSAVAALADKLD